MSSTNLYIENLHVSVTEAELYEIFQQYGNVMSIRVMRDEHRKSIGYAYVNYQTTDEALIAMNQVNLEPIFNRKCRIMLQCDHAFKPSGITCIFIKHLDPSITLDEIKETFGDFGEIKSCKLDLDESEGLAFVNFTREEDAEAAIAAINGRIMKDKSVNVHKCIRRTQRKANDDDYTNCYVKNFGLTLNDESLRGLFERFGEIVSAKVMLDDEGVSRGFGFVNFREHRDAARATAEMNGCIFRDNVLFVCRAEKKSDRKKNR